jgi:hypothetical protein
VLGERDYEGSVGLLTKVIAGRFGSGLGTFFFGFFTSRLRASLFPMPHRMPQHFAILQPRLAVRIPREVATPHFASRLAASGSAETL